MTASHSRLTVKICGLRDAATACAVAAAGADYVGLIRAASPRQVELPAAAQIVAALPPTTHAVLLFRDQPADEIVAALRTTGARWLQLHGDESPALVAEVAAAVPDLRVIRAWEVRDPSSAAAVRRHVDAVRAAGAAIDVLLLDAPKGGPHPGYACLADVARALRPLGAALWCAGGLTPENLADAVPAGTFHGVDVARGVERSPGVKDPTAIARFITTAHRIAPAPDGE